MSTRFVIDFPLPEDQYSKIDRFLSTHFPPPSKLANALKFLNILKEAVSRCRLGSHQELTMGIVNQLFSKVLSSLPRPLLLPTPVFSAPPNYQQGRTFSVYFVNLGHYHHPGSHGHPAPHNHHLGPHGHPATHNHHPGPHGTLPPKTTVRDGVAVPEREPEIMRWLRTQVTVLLSTWTWRVENIYYY